MNTNGFSPVSHPVHWEFPRDVCRFDEFPRDVFPRDVYRVDVFPRDVCHLDVYSLWCTTIA